MDLSLDFRKCEIGFDLKFFLVDFLLETEIHDCSLLIGLEHDLQFGDLQTTPSESSPNLVS